MERKVLCDTVHPDIGLRLVDVETGEHTPICHPQSSSSGSQWKTDRYALAEDWAAAQQSGDREKSPQLDGDEGGHRLRTAVDAPASVFQS